LPGRPAESTLPPMKLVTSPAAMQRQALRWKRAGLRVGFVPTMGFLHDGHLSLVRVARRRLGRGGRVVLSIYVNPAQFGPNEDFSRYPRDLAGDLKLCRGAGVDAVFAPADLYHRDAGAAHSTYVGEETLAQSLEGAARPGHFRGVTTVVAKLFNLVLPDVAVFGAKDWQQAAIIRRMVRDLDFPLKVIVAPTRREPDGLAMSSRNKYLVGELRGQAVVLSQALALARAAVRARPVSAARLSWRLKRFIEQQPAARLDYVAFFDPDTLAPVRQVRPGVQMALAVFVGPTRLIDNGRL
jgi:pantoate--beta-alanine ligase